MKYFLFTILIGACLILAQARSFPENEHTEKRFLKSVGGWINNNIVDPINNHVISPIVDGANTVIDGVSTAINVSINGVNTAINVITDPFVTFGNQFMQVVGSVDNFFSNTLVNAVNSAFDTIKSQTLNLVDMTANVIFPGGNNQPASIQDPCATTCFQRINFNNEISDYYFDRPNGCISKGIMDREAAIFNDCCDQHNVCLNSKCCTNDCQNLKNECDLKYNSCVRSTCKPFYDDEIQFQVCSMRAAYLVSSARNRTCNPQLTQNRKLCYC